MGSPIAPAAPAPEEGGSNFRDDYYISISTGLHGELIEEEHMALVLKASMDIAFGRAGGVPPF